MAKSKLFETLWVQVPSRTYPVYLGQELLQDQDFLNELITSQQVFIVSNNTVAPLYLSCLQKAFVHKQCDVHIIEDGEHYKNQDSLFAIYHQLMEKRHHRDTTLIALGGGVIGDLTGFAAATYQRGVRFIQIPTTLLAQVDASVGGKTAINHPLGKNMIGSFYQPHAVVMDLNTLHTLPQREFQAGFAEIIKYALLIGGDFLTMVQNGLGAGINNQDSFYLPMVIRRCCEIKARFVENDERESADRALLNLGHTVGHALEAYTHYKRWLHGEAVAIGLYCAALVSQRWYNQDDTIPQLVNSLLAQSKLPCRIPSDINLQELLSFMHNDKKIKNNMLRFVLIKEIGDCLLEEKIPESLFEAVLQDAVEGK